VRVVTIIAFCHLVTDRVPDNQPPCASGRVDGYVM